MKKFAGLLAAAMLTACTAHPVEFRLDDLRQPSYLRTERKMLLTFPTIQRALFKHKAACGSGPEFVLDDRQTSYATVYYKPDPSAKSDRTIVVALTFLQSGFVSAQAYSYYADTDKQIAELFSAITHPGVCPGNESPGQEGPGQESPEQSRPG